MGELKSLWIISQYNSLKKWCLQRPYLSPSILYILYSILWRYHPHKPDHVMLLFKSFQSLHSFQRIRTKVLTMTNKAYIIPFIFILTLAHPTPCCLPNTLAIHIHLVYWSVSSMMFPWSQGFMCFVLSASPRIVCNSLQVLKKISVKWINECIHSSIFKYPNAIYPQSIFISGPELSWVPGL